MVETNRLETQAQKSLARILELTRKERQDRLRTVASAFATLMNVAPVNAALALLPMLLLGPFLCLAFLFPFILIGVSTALLLQAATNSAALNWSLGGLLCTALLLAILLSDFGRACLLMCAWWLRFHYRFLLGDS